MAEDNCNLSYQADEIEALSAIYGEDLKVEEGRCYSVTIKSELKSGVSDNIITLHVTLPEEYPLHSPPIYQLSAPWLRGTSRRKLQELLESTYCDNIGECVLFNWVEKVREFLQHHQPDQPHDDIKTDDLLLSAVESGDVPDVNHGEVIVDRKSVFQAHASRITSVNQVDEVLTELKKNRKIADATHNVVAYRIYCEEKKCQLQDCDDDGESHAGNRLLHLLTILDVKNVIVVVSRWYGGTHLGPDRFKHINNAARNVLVSMGCVKTKVEEDKGKKAKTT